MNMKNLSVLIKPASSLCNLRCKYCFYLDESKLRSHDSYGIMQEEVLEKLIEEISFAMEEGGTVNISFQGGEPTLAGLDYFRRFISLMGKNDKIRIIYSIQTNGTMINEEWARFFKENSFLVGVSLDGYESNTNAFRYDASHKGAFLKILNGIEILRKEGVEFNILTVVTKDLAKHPKALMEFYRKHKFSYVQLIPCLPGLEDENDISLTPQLYAAFYKDFFREWKKEAEKGNVISVNLFENLAGMLSGYPPYQCGMMGRCTVQFVVEANGNVYPCDFYCLDEDCIGNIRYSSFEAIRESEKAKAFIQHSYCEKQPCKNCEFRKICYGGCKRQNVCYLTDTYCAYQEVLREILPEISRMISQNIK